MSDTSRLQESVDDNTARVEAAAKALEALADQQKRLLERLTSPTYRADLGRASELLGVLALDMAIGPDRVEVVALANRLRKEAVR